MLNVVILSVVILNVVILSVVMLNVVILNVVILNVVMLSVSMLSVVAPANCISKMTLQKCQKQPLAFLQKELLWQMSFEIANHGFKNKIKNYKRIVKAAPIRSLK